MKLLLIFYRFIMKIKSYFNSYYSNKILEYYKKKFGLKIGKYTYGYDYKTFFHLNNKDNATIIIGDYCSFGGGLKIFASAEHNYRRPSTFPFTFILNKYSKKLGYNPDNFSKGNVIIGNDVWIGDGVTILSGVNIGDGAVIGAGSIVSENIPPYTIAAGNRCIILKKRFSDDIIEDLLKIKWWNWDEKKVIKNYKFLNGDINIFLEKFKKK